MESRKLAGTAGVRGPGISHRPDGLRNAHGARNNAAGAGLTEEQAAQVLKRNPQKLIERLRSRSHYYQARTM